MKFKKKPLLGAYSEESELANKITVESAFRFTNYLVFFGQAINTLSESLEVKLGIQKNIFDFEFKYFDLDRKEKLNRRTSHSSSISVPFVVLTWIDNAYELKLDEDEIFILVSNGNESARAILPIDIWHDGNHAKFIDAIIASQKSKLLENRLVQEIFSSNEAFEKTDDLLHHTWWQIPEGEFEHFIGSLLGEEAAEKAKSHKTLEQKLNEIRNLPSDERGSYEVVPENRTVG